MEDTRQKQIIIVQSSKSMGLGLILTFLFGPLGMLYSTIAGGIIMMIIAPIVGFMTLGVGLIIIWPIQMIWSALAVSSHNNKISNSGQNTINIATEPTVTQHDTPEEVCQSPSESNLTYYNDANKLSDSRISELLSNKDELNADFIEALKFVKTERIMKYEEDNNRKSAYNKAMEIDPEERKRRIASPEIYSELSIKAQKYIQRCDDCEISPSENGFLATFNVGYVAPETRAERILRLKEEEADEYLRVQDKEAKLRRKAIARRNNYIALIVIGCLILCSTSYIYIIKPLHEYNIAVTVADDTFNTSNDYNAMLYYYEIAQEKLPFLGNKKKAEYISSQILSIKRDKSIEDAAKTAKAEAARKAEEERQRKAAAKAKYDRLHPTDAAAQYKMGYSYEIGNGVSQSYAEAAKWYLKSAKQGYAKAQYKMGFCYYNGQGVTQNSSESVKWYREAAKQGCYSAD